MGIVLIIIIPVAQITALSNTLRCKVAKEQRITHLLGTVCYLSSYTFYVANFLFQDYEASLPKGIEKGKFGIYDLTATNATGKDKTFSIKMDREGLKLHPEYNPPLR